MRRGQWMQRTALPLRSFPMGLNIGADRVNEVVQLVNTVLKIIIEERLGQGLKLTQLKRSAQGFNVTVSKIVQANLPILAGCPPHLAQRATESQCINETSVLEEKGEKIRKTPRSSRYSGLTGERRRLCRCRSAAERQSASLLGSSGL